MMRVLDLFSGIGGFSLGLERTGGFETVAFCEIEEFPRRVLREHWPDVPIYEDVRTLDAATLQRDGIAVDVVCGGFPCQDISLAGRGAGIGGARSGLWSEMCRLFGELRPQYAIVENVTALLSGPPERPGAWFSRVLGDLAEIGFDAEWHCIPASAAVSAPHIRDRVWLVGYPSGAAGKRRTGSIPRTKAPRRRARKSDGRRANGSEPTSESGVERLVSDANGIAPIGSAIARQERGAWPIEPDVARLAHGIPDHLDHVRAFGNAVVPQIPELIGRAILAAEAAPSNTPSNNEALSYAYDSMQPMLHGFRYGG
jgi:DNA (cytosine-5)-methyltransferase 1